MKHTAIVSVFLDAMYDIYIISNRKYIKGVYFMAKIKIVSNPYEKTIKFYSMGALDAWGSIRESNSNSSLREDESGRTFLPFKIKDILDTVIEDYYVLGKDKVQVVFEGTSDEYDEVKRVCSSDEFVDCIDLERSDVLLTNARDIFEDIKEIFGIVKPIITDVVKDDAGVEKDLSKVSDALKDVIPICVFGNYSAGKSTFINALIGREVLPSGGDPVTAKIYKIKKSKFEDRAKIYFTYKGKKVEFQFDEEDYKLDAGEAEEVFVQDVQNSIEKCEENNLFARVNAALEYVNAYEKKYGDESQIGNEIEIEIPFSTEGVLGRSQNNFVIFDTPGSNSETYAEHSVVLEQAMDNFSNGIPVWVTELDHIDTKDNAELCSNVLKIEALDKRFTMIVCNKADDSNLEEGGFSTEKETEIMEYKAVEKSYASGIYFVSSIMGLGAKNKGKLKDNHYRKTYRKQEIMFSDPEDEDYTMLYQYNLMPKQIKKRAIEYATECVNPVYANSGLLCIENEMETFASKHSAYNKCQMVFSFLDKVIDETNTRIDTRTESLQNRKKLREAELEESKRDLLDILKKTITEKEVLVNKEAIAHVSDYTKSDLDYSREVEWLSNAASSFKKENSTEHGLNTQIGDYEDAKNDAWANIKSHGSDLKQGKINKFFKGITEDVKKGYKDIQESKKIMEQASRGVDKETSDELIEMVNSEYRNNISEANDKAREELQVFWTDRAETLRGLLTQIITGTDSLSTQEKNELSEAIGGHEKFVFDDEKENIFIKKRFLRGTFLGIRTRDSEKLNLNRLCKSYNSVLKNNVKEMIGAINLNYFEAYKQWVKKLYALIEKNITEYNPELRDMAELIREETEKIEELTRNKQTLITSVDTIKDWMSWKKEE